MGEQIVAAAGIPESGPLSQRWAFLRAVDGALVLTQVTDLLSAGEAAMLEPAAMLTIVCEAAARHLRLANVVFFRRLAGQSRVLTWSAPGVSTASRMMAREQVWSSAATLVEDRFARAGGDGAGQIASASVWDEDLGLSAMLYVESLRVLDHNDRALLDQLLRRMLDLRQDDR
jgi:hypothetical protein